MSAPRSTVDRALPFRCRGDLVVAAQRDGAETVYAVKDPVALRYHRLREHEYFVLERLDGRRSTDELQREYERRFAPERVDAATLHGFVGRLHEAGLVEHLGPAEADRRWEAAERARTAGWWERASNLLAIRFRGFDPEPVLRFVERGFGWLLAGPMLALYGAVVLVAAAFVLVRWETFVARLPTAGEFLTPGNLVLLAVVAAGTKVLHEFGHALVQRRFGGECHEMGLLLLVFTPCLYVDVSDAWMLRERWKRIAVALAGIGVELVLAAVCTLVWWSTQPGVLNAVCLNLMVASTVGTVLFNGNPLLRYDGYFVLSDAVGVPNLATRAEAELGRVASAWCLGRPVPAAEGRAAGRAGLLVYAALARAYRWFVLALVGWGLYHAAKPFGLGGAVVALMSVVVGVGVLRTLAGATRRLVDPLWRRGVMPGRVLLSVAVAGGLLAGLLAIPVPGSVGAPSLVRLADAEAVYVRVPGTLVRSVPYGSRVSAGTELATLVDAELDLELARLHGERELLESRIASLEARRGLPGVDGDALPALERALETARESERRRARDFADLVVRASRGGVLVPPAERAMVRDEDALGAWSGRPFDGGNAGAYLERGTLLGHVGDPRTLEVVALVDQTDVEFVRPGQRATVVLGQRPGDVVEGTVRDVTEAAADDVPPELSAWAELPRRANDDGRPELVGTWFVVRITVAPGSLTGVRPRARGHATVHVAPRTLGGRLSRWLRTVLRFES